MREGIAHGPGPALDARHGPPGSDQREVHRQQRLQPHLLQAEEEAGRQSARHVGAARRCLRADRRARTFSKPRRIIQERSRRFTDQELLERLRRSLLQKGWLSGLIIDEIDDMPSSSTYRHRFGSLLRAYQLVGYSPARDYRYIEINRALRAMHPDVVNRRDRGRSSSTAARCGGTRYPICLPSTKSSPPRW